MRTEVINASDINEAAKEILEELKKDNTSDSRCNVVYFDGWDGLGASAVLQHVAKLLKPKAKAEEPVLHIDCSKWVSRREMQRMIVEQLKLPTSMMEVFSAQDEEDDFKGVAKGSRTEIHQIAEVINRHIQKQCNNFLLIFHNGSSEEINLNSLGFPLFDGYSRSKVLWSFQGRFRAYPRTKVDVALKNTSTTDVYIFANSSDIGEDKLSGILHYEAKEVSREMMKDGNINWPTTSANCFLNTVKLCRMGSDLATDYDLTTHICNYWRCDAIVHDQQTDIYSNDYVEKFWIIYDALEREMRFDVENLQNPYFPSLMQRGFLKNMPYWTSPTYGFILISDPLGQFPNCMLQRFDKLCVLKLSTCMFSFTSPPFLCCHNIKFLWLDHCRDGSNPDEAVNKEDIGKFFQRLWVLDIRYSSKAFLTDQMIGFLTQLRELNVMGDGQWLDTRLLQGQMNNIHKLRITKSNMLTQHNKILGRDKLELLEFSENNYPGYFSVGISCGSLKTVIISGPSILDEISLVGCAKLKNIVLSGLFKYLKTIKITDAAVETLDLRTVTAQNLNHLFLRACQNLFSILWSPIAENKRKPYLDELHIDTSTQKKNTSDTSVVGREFSWDISIRDARILQSLEPVKDYFGHNNAHVEISTPTHFCGDATSSKDNKIMSSSEPLIKENVLYAGVADECVFGHAPSPAILPTSPPSPDMPPKSCYIYIEDLANRTKSQTTSIALPGFICDAAKILHVHDSLHVTSILDAPLTSATWNQLEWCQVEGCPSLECIFNIELLGGPEGNDSHKYMFRKLRTTWASYLPKAQYIWKWSAPSKSNGSVLEDMTMLHIDCCHRLRFIIFHVPMFSLTMDNLETLEIMWCGDLSVAFSFNPQGSRIVGWKFQKLKHIHLHELPKLLNISDPQVRIEAPQLETIKIRGCWSLKKLPVVGNKKVVVCNCEKEWWDTLEWESKEHADTYKPTHPRHYKKKMLKYSILR